MRWWMRCPRCEWRKQVAKRQHFFHWELEFADQFKSRGGFDLVLGNPPWIKVEWNEQALLSDFDPRFAIRRLSAKGNRGPTCCRLLRFACGAG
jgi:methylase of polypeptide subunit release factors